MIWSEWNQFLSFFHWERASHHRTYSGLVVRERRHLHVGISARANMQKENTDAIFRRTECRSLSSPLKLALLPRKRNLRVQTQEELAGLGWGSSWTVSNISISFHLFFRRENGGLTNTFEDGKVEGKESWTRAPWKAAVLPEHPRTENAKAKRHILVKRKLLRLTPEVIILGDQQVSDWESPSWASLTRWFKLLQNCTWVYV